MGRKEKGRKRINRERRGDDLKRGAEQRQTKRERGQRERERGEVNYSLVLYVTSLPTKRPPALINLH